GRFDRPVDALAASVARIRRYTRGGRRVVLITGTEASHRSGKDMHQVLDANGWEWAHLSGERGAGECWGTWSTSALQLVESYTHRLTEMTWTRSAEYGGGEAPPVTALVLQFEVVGRPYRRTVTVIVVHWPLANTERRQEIWKDCALGLRRLEDQIRARDPHTALDVVGDLNRNYRQDADRRLIDHYIAAPLRLVQAWAGSTPVRGGTHGPRSLLDGAVLDRRLLGWSTPWCWLLPDDDSSDHRPFAHTLRWPLLPRRARRRIRHHLKETT
ncbi:hypothetical protein ACFP8W_08360, partial [Nocardioides hankookensis]